MSNTQLAYVDERRSTRIDHSVSLMIHGFDLSRSPYQEHVSTVAINYHGCRYRTRHEMLRGDVVFLVVNQPDEEHTVFSTRARVKWLQATKLDGDNAFEVAVELEAPGNIWGISAPPSDWSKHPETALVEAHPTPRNLRMLPRPEPAAVIPNQLIEGLGEYVQRMALDATSAALAAEKRQMIDAFREELQDEAARTLQHALAASKNEFALQAIRELTEAHEVTARTIHERWSNKIEQEMNSATMRIATHGAAAGERVESMAISTIEQMQKNMDASRNDAVNHCLTRLRNELVPLLEQVQTALDKLAASENEIKIKSLTICQQFEDFLNQEGEKAAQNLRDTLSTMEKQFESTLVDRAATAQDQMTKKWATIFEGSNENLRRLFTEFDEKAQNRLESLVASTADQLGETVKQRSEKISRDCTREVENHTREHLDFISQSLSAITKKASR